MNATFYGTIQHVEAIPGRLTIRCVREFFHGDGLMADDVWSWEIESPDQSASTKLQSMVGRPIVAFEVTKSNEGQSLLIGLDEGHDSISVAGKSIEKKEGPRDHRDLEVVVSQLSQQIFRNEADYLALNQKLTAVATFVEQKIDRIRRRAEFELQRAPAKSEAIGREIEDLQAILQRLKRPNQAPEPTPGSVTSRAD